MKHMLPSQCHSINTSKSLPKSIFFCSSTEIEVLDEFNFADDIEEGSAQKV